jgi:UDP-2,4-diacetamido-2,4,6-trideoxy-beta-L-altropyranose hydrolase
MRGLALAQAWLDAGGRAACLSHRMPQWLRGRLTDEKVNVLDLDAQPAGEHDARETVAAARELGADWVAVDGYAFDAAYLAAVRQGGSRTLLIDDTAALGAYPVDALLNPNLHAAGERYETVADDTELMLGSRFALVRREFWSRAGVERRHPDVARRLLVSLGGIDSHDVALRLLPALQRIAATGLEVALVAGALDERPGRIAELAGAVKGLTLLTDLRDVPALMAEVDVALAAAGSTCWELAVMRVPSLVFALADNQSEVAESLARAGAAIDLGWHEQLTAERVEAETLRLAGDCDRRRELAASMGRLVDGEGGRRVVMHLRGDALRLRPARREDCRLLWEWVNEPEVRASAFSPEPIPWETHRGWFESRAANGSLIFIAIDAEDEPVGQVRFDPSGEGEAEIDLSVAPTHRGRGAGSRMIALGTDRLFRETSVSTVHAFVKPDNTPSLRAFERAGFDRLSPAATRGQQAIHCRIERAS